MRPYILCESQIHLSKHLTNVHLKQVVDILEIMSRSTVLHRTGDDWIKSIKLSSFEKAICVYDYFDVQDDLLENGF